MSEIVEYFGGTEVCAGDVMPWGNMTVEGTKFLICSGLTGRDPNKKQEYPELLERDDFTTADQAALNVCPHNIEDQVVLILEKYKKLFNEVGTSFDNVFYCDYYTIQRSDFPTAWRAFKKWMDKECPDWFKRPRPGVLTVQHGLDHPDMLIEIKMWATIPESAGDASKKINGSRIAKWLPGPTLGGDVMPWGHVIIEGNKFFIPAGLTGRSFGKKQEYPELIERENFETVNQVALTTCPHNIEDQVIIIMEKIKAALHQAGTSFENVFYIDYYLTHRHNWPNAFRTMKKYMDRECPDFFKRPRPAVLAILDGLDHPDMLIEVRMWATIPESAGVISKVANGSRIAQYFAEPEVLAGDVMPWGNVIVEGNKWLFCAGMTGRDPNKKQEYPEQLERDDFSSADKVALDTCPHNIEDQVIQILEGYKKSFERAGTSFDNVFLCDYFVTERYNWPRAWRTFKKWLDKECPDWWKKPKPGVLSIVHGLDHPDMLIEIRMWACIPE
ncbi:hypothetical protein ACFLVM_02370 [Chloroflexota bacterium]